ncbi:MAG: hypothetical protein QUS66_08380 [Bacteroidota bacterium]|nr:hypothetical protein [Bacteroidota bacterium]
MTELIIRIMPGRRVSALAAGMRSACGYGEFLGADLMMVFSLAGVPERNE